MGLVRGLGRANNWAHDYWRTIGWREFWASLAELIASSEPSEESSELAPLVALESRIAASTGLSSPVA